MKKKIFNTQQNTSKLLRSIDYKQRFNESTSQVVFTVRKTKQNRNPPIYIKWYVHWFISFTKFVFEISILLKVYISTPMVMVTFKQLKYILIIGLEMIYSAFFLHFLYKVRKFFFYTCIAILVLNNTRCNTIKKGIATAKKTQHFHTYKK